ncbi:adenylate/guanylate cyclase domain-containing protein [bacterium]|nr:adenylate/guanylate cyclase domain-containing protein [bacterium]
MDKNLRVKFLVFILFLLVSVLIYIASVHYFDNKTNDFFTKIITVVKNNKSSDNVVLVEIDDKSLNEISWPWRRDLFSNIFDYLENYCHAKVIVFNNLILYPDTYYPESDKVFNNSLKNYKNVINSYILFNSGVSGDILPNEYIDIFNTKTDIKIRDERTDKFLPSYRGIVNLPKEFLISTNALAASIIPEDRDEIVRNYMPIVKYNDDFYPSVALSAYSMYTGIKSYVLYDNYLCSDDNCKTLKMPVIQKKNKDYIGNTVYGIFTYVNWYKPTGKFYTHKKYSAIDVINSYNDEKLGNTPKLSPELFKDKIVLVGLNSDQNVWDRLSETSILKKQSDIDVHATVISNMLQNSFKTLSDNVRIIFLTIFFCFFIIRGFRHLKDNLIFTAILASLYLIYYIFQFNFNVLIPPISPIIIMFTAAILKFIYTVITSDRNSELMKKAMSKYVSKDVMKKVVSNLDTVKLGGVRTEVTILFIDIRNFTQIAESLPPNEVSSILNDYFSVVEPIIVKYDGVVNKYMGDGILALFGEPVKNENHAINAVTCGMEIINEVNKLKENFIVEGKPKIDIGLGINTGEAFVGNVGSDERLEYTVIGDSVNLASRIETYNHILKTQFLISEYTYEYVKDYVDVVKLSEISLKGKSKPIDMYEVLRINKIND